MECHQHQIHEQVVFNRPRGICQETASKPTSSFVEDRNVTYRLAAVLNNVGVMLHTVADYKGSMEYYREAVQVRVAELGPDASREDRLRASVAAAARLDIVCDEGSRLRLQLGSRLSDAVQEAKSQQFDILTASDSADLCEWRNCNCGNDGDQTFFTRMSKPWPVDVGAIPCQENSSLENPSKEYDDCLNSSATLYNMAMIHHDTRNLEKARELYRMSLTLLTKAGRADEDSGKFDSDHNLMAAAVHNNLGQIQYASNRLDDALQSYAFSLHLQQQLPHHDVDSLSSTLAGIGRVHFRRNELYEAMEAFTEHLRVCREALGDDHIDVAVSLYNIGMVHYATGDKVIAAECCGCFVQQAGAISEDNRHVATALHTIGVIMCEIGGQPSDEELKVQESKKALHDALRIRRALFGDNHAEVADTLFQLGRFAAKQKKDNEALELYRQSLEIKRICYLAEPTTCHLEELPGFHQKTRDLITILYHMGQIELRRDNHSVALRHYNDALAYARTLPSNDLTWSGHTIDGGDKQQYRNQAVSWLLVAIGKIHLELNDVDKAIELFSNAHKLYSTHQIDDSDLVVILCILKESTDPTNQHASTA